eukprot:scaffold41762_cov157-Isochrysis_galbana.AAC.1
MNANFCGTGHCTVPKPYDQGRPMHECDTRAMLTFPQPACTTGTKRALTSTVELEGDWKVDKVVGMERRAGITHVAVRWQGFGAEGDTWEVDEYVHPPSKMAKFISNADVHLGMSYVRQAILNTMIGKTIKDRVPRFKYEIPVGQLCYDDIAVKVIQEFGRLPGVKYKSEQAADGVCHFAMVETLEGAAAFLLGHVARPDVANGSLRIKSGRVSFLDMAKLLPGTFVQYFVPGAAHSIPNFSTRKGVVCLNSCTFNGLTSTPSWPAIAPPSEGGLDERFSMVEMDAIVDHAKLELRQHWTVRPVSHPLRDTWAKTPTGPGHPGHGWNIPYPGP